MNSLILSKKYILISPFFASESKARLSFSASVNAEIARDNEAHHVFDELSKKFVAAKEVKNLDRTENKENNMLVDAESAYANAVKSETEKLAKDFSDMKNKANLKRAHK